MTGPEVVLWNRLRLKQLNGYQFYRQKPIDEYIVDFYCPAAKLVIEIDGDSHYTDEQRRDDVARDVLLSEQGLRVLRFDNAEVMNNLDGVVETILAGLH